MKDYRIGVTRHKSRYSENLAWIPRFRPASRNNNCLPEATNWTEKPDHANYNPQKTSQIIHELCQNIKRVLCHLFITKPVFVSSYMFPGLLIKTASKKQGLHGACYYLRNFNLCYQILVTLISFPYSPMPNSLVTGKRYCFCDFVFLW